MYIFQTRQPLLNFQIRDGEKIHIDPIRRGIPAFM
jgi:hypothetical protein